MNNNYTYNAYDCVVFCKTKEKWGEFSNMSSEFPLTLQGIVFPTAEHLYQSMKHLDDPELIKRIIETKSPVAAKRIAYEKLPYTPGQLKREDNHEAWLKHYATDVMFAVVSLKYLQYKNHFESLREELDHRKIVEYSTKDTFWGMRYREPGVLSGDNALGRIWMTVYRLAEEGKLTHPTIFDQLIGILK